MTNQKNSIPETHQSRFKRRGLPVQQIDKRHHLPIFDHQLDEYSTTLGDFSTLHQSSIASPLNPPIGIKTPAARAAPPAPRASHVPAQHVPPAARSLPPSRTLTKLGHLPYGPTTPSTRRSLDQFGHGPEACSTRISPAHKTSNRLRPRTSSWKSSQTGCSSTLQKPMVTKS